MCRRRAQALVFAALVAVVVKLPGKETSAPVEAVQPAEEKVSYAELFRPNILLFYASFLVFQLVMMVVLSFSPTWLQLQGVDPTMSGFISTLPMLLAVVSSPVIGSLSDKFGRCKPFLIIGMLSMGPCAFLLLAGSGVSLWIGAIVMGLLGLGVPVMSLTAYPHILGRPELMSIGMGFLMLVQSLGQFLGTFVSPYILGPAGDQWMTLGIVMCVLGLIGAGCAALCKFK